MKDISLSYVTVQVGRLAPSVRIAQVMAPVCQWKFLVITFKNTSSISKNTRILGMNIRAATLCKDLIHPA